MRIDLTSVPHYWINLDSATENAKAMIEQFGKLGITKHIRVPGVVQAPPAGAREGYGNHYIGCGLAHIAAMEAGLAAGELPFAILEDDAAWTGNETVEIHVPANADAVYLGISTGSADLQAHDIGRGMSRIASMLSAHAIMYMSAEFAHRALKIARHCIWDLRAPLDLGMAQLQREAMVVAFNKPCYIQADSRSSENKWEFLTRELLPTQMYDPKNGAIAWD
jgi:hypothetical protein